MLWNSHQKKLLILITYLNIGKNMYFFTINPDMEASLEIRSGMHPRIELEPIDMLTYKKAILFDFSRIWFYIGCLLVIWKSKIIVFSGGVHKDRKITKVITEP